MFLVDDFLDTTARQKSALHVKSGNKLCPQKPLLIYISSAPSEELKPKFMGCYKMGSFPLKPHADLHHLCFGFLSKILSDPIYKHPQKIITIFMRYLGKKITI